MSSNVSHGYLPAGRYIVNHDIMNCTAEGVSGNDLYSGRALGLTEPNDYIQLHPVLRPLWRDITDHYHRIGLSHSNNVIWDVSLDQLSAYEGYRPSVFYFGPEECKAWNDPAWLETVEFINSKNNFMTLAEQLNIDVPQTRCFASADSISEMDIISFNMPCYLKAAISVSGVGIYRCANREQLRDAMKKFKPGVPVQLQEEIKTIFFSTCSIASSTIDWYAWQRASKFLRDAPTRATVFRPAMSHGRPSNRWPSGSRSGA